MTSPAQDNLSGYSATTLAYLAGVIDSDGCISIKRSTYAKRKNRDGTTNPIYCARVTLKQVTEACPRLMHETFGGPPPKLMKPRTKNNKPLWRYEVRNHRAVNICAALLPFLRIKGRQAECCLALDETNDPKYRVMSFWFAAAHPDWSTGPLLTIEQAREKLSYPTREAVCQAIRKGMLLSTRGGCARPRRADDTPEVPQGLVERIAALPTRRTRPPELVAWRHSLWDEVRHLNKIGVNGTTVFHRTGPHTPAQAYGRRRQDRLH